MATPHRTHRPSAERRREALLRAAIEIIGEQGVSAATHRAIAARAGVPLATTSYFFRSIDELLEEAFRTWVKARSAELEAAATAALAARAEPGQIVDTFVAMLMNMDRAAELAQYESYLQAARSPALREVVAEAQISFERVAAAGLRAAGARDPDEGARAFAALTDGFVLQHLAHPRPDAAQALRRALTSLFIAYAMNEEDRARWDALLNPPG